MTETEINNEQTQAKLAKHGNETNKVQPENEAENTTGEAFKGIVGEFPTD